MSYQIKSVHMVFYKKLNSRPSTKSFSSFGHILVLKVSYKFLNLASYTGMKSYAERECRNLFVL